MYLKRLDLHGFKSFAARTAFDFGPGITAIVGPNGCGKSNVADALRWVLGEQSGKLLRARKLEDVIFAGSSRRPPATAAEISLTLDNSDGWLPLDFTEAAITRRAYRSGESTYLLNRQRSRLRDIADLFLKARAGQSNYAIMGQGLVETILNFRPEERRLLLEEVADLEGHRFKLQEAQQRLAATRENMERVSLLLQEITPHLSHLERQARRASRRADLEQELKGALRAWYSHAWRRGQGALEQAQGELDEALEQAQAAEEQLAQSEERLSELRRLLEAQRSGTAPEDPRLAQARQRHALLQEQVSLDRQRHTLLAERRPALQQELAALEGERRRLAQTLEDEAEIAALQQEAASCRQAIAPQEEELAALQGELAERRRRVAAADESQAAARTAVVAAQSRLRGWLEAQARRPDPAPAATLQLQLAIGELLDLAKEYARLRAQGQGLLGRLAAVEGSLRQLERRREEQRALRDSRQERLHQVEVQLARLQTQLRAVEETSSAELPLPRQGQALPPAVLQPPLPALLARPPLWRRILAAIGLRGGRSRRWETVPLARTPAAQTAAAPALEMPGILATVADLITVPPGLERAITAALADRAAALVVANRRDALAAAQAIARHEGPHTLLLPLSDLQTVYPPYLLREPGVIGVAANLVRCADRYRPLVNALLGRTIVVEDLATAQHVLRRGMGSVVTRDGILLQPWGLVASGRGSAALQRQRDLRTIPRQLQRLQRQKGKLEAEAASLATALSQSAGELESLRRELAALTAQRQGLQAALAASRQRIGRAQGEIRYLLTTQRAATTRVPSATPERTRLEMEQEHQHLATTVVEAELRAQEEHVAATALAQRGEALAKALTEARVRTAALEGRLPALQRLRQSQQEALAGLEAQMGQRRSQLEALAREERALEERLRSREEALTTLDGWLSDQAATAAPDLERADLERADLELSLQAAEAEVDTGRDSLLAIQRRRLEAEVGLQRQQREVEDLRRHLGEDGFAVSDDDRIIAQGDGSVTIPPWLAADQGEESSDDPDALRECIEQLRSQLRAMGVVNPQAEEEYHHTKERHDFLLSQMADLQGAERSLRKAIEELEEVMGQRFAATFQKVGEEFQRYFVTFFGGGYAKLILTPPEDYKISGVDIIAQPPGKRLQSLNMLSGGEKALTAIALLFALLQTSPSPFCVLDEVDAALDEANVGRFLNALRELSQRTQFIVITHNRRTIEVADRIYGVAMGPEGISKVLSLHLADVPVG